MNGFDTFPFISFLVLIALISGRVVFLKRKGINVSSDSGKKNKPIIFLYFAFSLILLLWLFELTKPVFHISIFVLPEVITKPLIESDSMKIAGVLVTGFALALLTLTLLHFRNSFRFGLDEKNRGELITTGVFAFSRNPFFLSLDIYFVGIAILLPNLFFIGFGILTLGSIHFFILKEEKFMQSVYGGEYLEYQRKVRRYL
jgi:protein-S-isoprenylcysteine O-methyltransferase Ste14